MQSSPRNGAPIYRIYLHTAEGATTVGSLAGFLEHSDGGYQVLVDPTSILRVAGDDQILWSEGGDNTHAVALCFCAFAAWTTAEWMAQPKMLELAAQQVATWCRQYNIKPVHVRPGAIGHAPTDSGIAEHADDHDPNSQGHTDPGAGFPIDWFDARVAAILAPPIDWVAIEQLVKWRNRVSGTPLVVNSSSVDVVILKKLLASKGHDVGNLLPLYGENVVAAVAAFKREHGIAPANGNEFGSIAAHAILA